MANLIITVIAIALVAVASLMGAYYGGAAFLNNQQAADASSVLNQGQQIAGAWQAYMSDHLGTPPSTATVFTDITSGSNPYLASTPNYPAAYGGVASSQWTWAAIGTHNYAFGDVGKGSTIACDKIAAAAVGAANVTSGGGATPGAAGTGNSTFGCLAPAAGHGSVAAADYAVYYLLN